MVARGGVYTITNTVTGEQYVGASANLNERAHQHRQTLRNGKHQNKVLQAAWNKHGEEVFTFCPVELIESEGMSYSGFRNMLTAAEDRWIANLNPAYNRYRRKNPVVLEVGKNIWSTSRDAEGVA